MTRVTSQKTRQAVLVTGDNLDPNTLPEKMELFNELGEPLMLGGGYARYSKELNPDPGTVGAGASVTGAVELYASVRLWKIKTSRPARVRMYPTADQRDADLPRGVGIKPPAGNHGRLLEVVTTAAFLELFLSPVVDMSSVANTDANFYYAIQNLDAVQGPVIVTFSYFRTE